MDDDLDPITKALNDADLTDHEAVKREQIQRIDRRDNFAYATLLVIGTSLAGTLQSHSIWPVLLVPYACYILGWKAFSNDNKVSRQAQYSSELGARFRARLRRLGVGADAGQVYEDINGTFGWERYKNGDGLAAERRLMSLIADAVLFLVPGYAAVLAAAAGVLASPSLTTGLQVTVAALGAGLTVLLSRAIVRDYLRQRQQAKEARS